MMIDGSKLDYEGNIEVSKKVADVAASMGIPCEAELGKVGGKEDDLVAVADTNTDPQEAREFVERTGVTSLAVAIGTAHGFYVGTPVLDKERLSEIREVVDIPLVLHGASGLSDEDVMDCVKRGICKVNFATELRAAYSKAVRETLEDEKVFDPKAYGKAGIAAVKELVMARMKFAAVTERLSKRLIYGSDDERYCQTDRTWSGNDFLLFQWGECEREEPYQDRRSHRRITLRSK